jgi:hypothetical protein
MREGNVLELGEAHIHARNLEALTWERQFIENKNHNLSNYDKVGILSRTK